jgi:hypothetical protein
MQWLVDYAAAVTAGMAVDVTLPPGTNTLDRVVAVGVRASTAAPAGAAELATLFSAHRYTDGLGFLAAGAPTANAPDARAAADRRADPDALWQQEFGEPASAGSAAARLAIALGLPNAGFDGTAGADDPGDVHAQAMQTALWAATWGYYLGELLDSGGPSAATIDAIRSHYLNFVRGQGTLPTLRIGRQPYGLLPTLPLANWSTDGASPTVDALAQLLGRVRPLWEFGTGVPLTASEGPAFDQAFAAAMSTDAVARAYAIRSVIADLTIDPLIFTGVDPLPSHAVLDAIVGSLLPGGHNPLVLDVLSPSAEPVRAPFVVDPRDPTPDATVRAAISQLTASNPTAMLIQNLLLTPRAQGPATLLHTLLRRSLLLEYAAAGVGLRGPLLQPGPQVTATSTALRFAAPVGMLRGLSPDPAGGFTAVTSLSAVVSTPVATVTGGLATGEWLWRNPTQFPNLRRTLDQTLAALAVLATLSASELELLLPNALDLATHRFTAWAESVAADKLTRLRQATPAGATLGGWGVVERLTRAPRTAVDVSLAHGAATGALWETDRPGGFVAAPSTAQAATVAVLRAAHLAHGGDNDPTCAVDLSSTRARGAASLADGVRSGQELGALLGYELERFLHEHSADALIAPLRALAPRWKASGTFVEGQPETNVSPSAVVDGLALVNADPAAVAQTVIPGGPGASPGLAAALAAGLANLRDHQDALADLLMAETVHHTLAGNTARAAGVLDAAHRGGPPPDDFDVLRTPRGGAGLTCRVGVLMADPSGPLPGGWPESPRGHADPACANLVAGLLPPLARVRLRVSNAAGAVSDAEVPAGALIGPLDLVLDVPAVLRTRIELALPAGSRLVSGRSPSWPVTTVGLDELQTVAADLREILAGRALTAADLLPASSPAPAQDPRDGADMAGRVSAVRSGLQTVTAELGKVAAAGSTEAADGQARAALGGALAYGLAVQLPPEPAPADVSAAMAGATAEIGRRLAAPVPTAGATVDDLAAALKGLLGAAQPALTRLRPDGATASAAASALAAGDAHLQADPEVAADWISDAAGVRDGAARLAAAVRGCEALAGPSGLPASWRILDWPHAGSAWSATLDAAALASAAPVTTAVVWSSANVAATAGQPLSGLITDEWAEIVPEPTASLSITYQAQAPAARAPQAILLGLVPSLATGWTVDAVVAAALDAVDLGAIRLVDAERAAWTGRVLPAVLLPDGDATDVIAAPPMPLLQVDTALLQAVRADAKELG